MMAISAKDIAGKVWAIFFPIMAFVASGFEHCVANMYFIPLGLLLDAFGYVEARPSLTWLGMANNLIPVTLGNVAGGAGMVGLVYYVIYVHHERSQEKP